jgi:hypothetical protein
MAIGSGLGAQLGIVAEATYGTPVTVSRFLDFNSEDLKYVPTFTQGGGIRGGTFAQPTGRRVVTTSQAGGSIEREVQFAKEGLLLQALMGTSVTPVQQAATTAYLQTHTLADPLGKSLTIQKGIPQTDGTVKAHTFAGCRVTSAEFSCGVDEFLVANYSIDAKSWTDQTALASASYTASNGFHFAQMAVKLGTFGSEASVSGVRKVSVQIDRSLKTDMFYAGNAGAKAQPVLGGWTTITGSVETDFASQSDFSDKFSSNTSTSLVWEFVGTTAIATTYFPTFRITLPGVFFDEGTPAVGGPDVVQPSYSFTWQYDGTNLPKIEYLSTDSAV